MQLIDTRDLRLSLKERLLFHTRNLGDASERLSQIFCSHIIKCKDRTAGFDAYFYHAPLVSTSVSYLGFDSATSTVLGDIKDFFLLEMPVSGYVEIRSGYQRVRLTPNMASVISPSERIRITNSENCWKLLVKIGRSTMENHLSRLLGRPVTKPLIFDVLIDLTKDSTLCDTVNYVTDQVVKLNSRPVYSHFLMQLEQLLVSAILHTQRHSYSEALLCNSPAIAPRHVRLAEKYMECNFEHDLTLQDVAATSRVSVAALCQGFQRFRGISPMKYLKLIRLERARQALMQAGPDTNVTRISQECGFRQSGRFAVEYKKRFGQSPSQTLRGSALEDWT